MHFDLFLIEIISSKDIFSVQILYYLLKIKFIDCEDMFFPKEYINLYSTKCWSHKGKQIKVTFASQKLTGSKFLISQCFLVEVTTTRKINLSVYILYP